MAKAKVGIAETGDAPDVAYVNPAVISWAFKRSLVSRDEAARKLGIPADQIEAWQRPNGPAPPFAKAEALAKLLHVPFGFFYLNAPPAADLPLPDFRGFDRTYKPSTDLVELLNDILVKQDWYRDHERGTGSAALKFVDSFTIKDDVEEVAAAIRNHIGITVAVRQSASTWSDYLSILSRRAENVGVLVMRSGVVGNITTRKLDTSELLGFAIADPYAPVVFINSGDYRTSQVFTLAHELAHLWIGQTAIANPDELEVGHNRVEAFCNRVAAEVLVPRREFLNEWRGITSSPDVRMNRTARRFWVSTFVTLRRAHELSEISDEQFETLKKSERARRRKEKGGGGDYYRNIWTRMSPRFTGAVLKDVNDGKLELRDAAGLLNMKVPTLVKFAEKEK